MIWVAQDVHATITVCSSKTCKISLASFGDNWGAFFFSRLRTLILPACCLSSDVVYLVSKPKVAGV